MARTHPVIIELHWKALCFIIAKSVDSDSLCFDNLNMGDESYVYRMEHDAFWFWFSIILGFIAFAMLVFYLWKSWRDGIIIAVARTFHSYRRDFEPIMFHCVFYFYSSLAAAMAWSFCTFAFKFMSQLSNRH